MCVCTTVTARARACSGLRGIYDRWMRVAGEATTRTAATSTPWTTVSICAAGRGPSPRRRALTLAGAVAPARRTRLGVYGLGVYEIYEEEEA